jgi:hypothetical protein
MDTGDGVYNDAGPMEVTFWQHTSHMCTERRIQTSV